MKKMHFRSEIGSIQQYLYYTKHIKSFVTKNICSSTQLLLWDTTTLLGM